MNFNLDTVFQIKRLMGRQFNDSSVQKDIKHFPFSVIETKGKPMIQLNTRYGEKLFTPEEISAMILGKMRDIAVSFVFHLSQDDC
jgi:heat shock protein 5